MASHRFLVTATTAALLAAAPLAAQTRPEITAADLRTRVEILAHDSMGGRGTGSPGIRKAADYLAAELRRLGLRPAGDAGTYFHRVDLERTQVAFAGSVEGGRAPIAPGDVLPVSGMAGLPATTRTAGEGPLVFGGWQADDLAASSDVPLTSLQGAVLVMRFGARPGAKVARTRFVLPALVGPSSPLTALVLVAEGEIEPLREYAEETLREGSLARTAPASGMDLPPIFVLRPEAAARLLGVASLDGAREPATGMGTFRYTLRSTRAAVEAMNVVAVLPGRDAARAGQFVAVGAHYDHVGTGVAVDGDSIYNGADDDASGTAGLVEIAERLASLPEAQRPARSILFVWHTAEEDGLLGSEQFSERPSVPRDSIVAQLNIDMIGRNSPDSVIILGSRRLSTQLGDVVEAVNGRQARPFAIDYSWDAPDHPERFYCRSDHYNYARFGIPVAFFTTGLHAEYHEPTDEASTIDYEKLARVTALISDATAEVGSLPARPVVDKPLPPLGTPCQ